MDHVTVQSTSELEDLCARAQDLGRLGIDTEFLWERTYAPQICLVQLNVGGTIAIVDPLAGIEIEAVSELLDDPAVEIVMHAPHADLVAFAHRHGARPTNVFDTQLAAGFIGLSAGLSYERLVQETTGAKVQPSESFTDWSRRPLTDKQLRYAGEDVEHLFAMADHINAGLERLGRVEWARDELDRRFCDAERLVPDVRDAWRRVGRRGKLGPKDLAVLQEVAAWRESLARRRDIPSGWVLKDPSLVELARRRPKSVADLSKIRGLDGSLKQRDREELVDAMQHAAGHALVEEGDPPPRGVRQRVTIAKGLATAVLRARCDDAEIASELVGTSADLEELIGWVASGGADDPTRRRPTLLTGWRERIGDDIVDLVEGRVALRLTAREPFLVIEGLD